MSYIPFVAGLPETERYQQIESEMSMICCVTKSVRTFDKDSEKWFGREMSLLEWRT